MKNKWNRCSYTRFIDVWRFSPHWS